MDWQQEEEWRQSYPLSVPAVRDIHDRAISRLQALGWPELAPFFTELLARFARWTMDLPGSERHHHSYPYGLLIHSADTVDRAFALGADCIRWLPLPWLQVLLILALFHDCGRLLDFVVRDPASGDTWDPLHA